jgi:hypothetical protein
VQSNESNLRLTQFSIGDDEDCWLLDPRIMEITDKAHIVVSFSSMSGFEDCAHSGRWAKTVKPNEQSCSAGPGQIELKWTDKRSKLLTKLVPVTDLLPVKPAIGKKAVMIKGPSIGKIVTYKRKVPRSEDKLVVEADGKKWNESLSNLCRIDLFDE